MVILHVLLQLLLELWNLFNGNAVEVTVGNSVDDANLLRHFLGRVVLLLQHSHNTLA